MASLEEESSALNNPAIDADLKSCKVVLPPMKQQKFKSSSKSAPQLGVKPQKATRPAPAALDEEHVQRLFGAEALPPPRAAWGQEVDYGALVERGSPSSIGWRPASSKSVGQNAKVSLDVEVVAGSIVHSAAAEALGRTMSPPGNDPCSTRSARSVDYFSDADDADAPSCAPEPDTPAAVRMVIEESLPTLLSDAAEHTVCF